MFKNIVLIIITLIFSCSNENQTKVATEPDSTQTSYDTIRANAIKLEVGWGYDVSINGKTYIYQTIIPAIEGNYTFGSEEDAQKAANFVGQKILQNNYPPSVEESELDSLGVLKNKIELIVN